VPYLRIFYFLFARPLWRESVRTALMVATVALGVAVVLAIDARRRPDGGWNVYTRGGRDDEGIDAVEWAARGEALGAGEILLTSMDTDGVQTGFDCPLTRAVSRATRIPVIASGGVSSLADIAALRAHEPDGVAGIICGRALYDGRIDPQVALRLIAEPLRC